MGFFIKIVPATNFILLTVLNINVQKGGCYSTTESTNDF